MQVEILAFGAHSDDVELGCGGLLLKMKRAGHGTGIVDLTRSELNSRAAPEVIAKEAEEAAEILGVDLRERLDLGDARLQDSYENRLLIAEVIRRYRPKVILAPYWSDRHPDHAATGLLVKNSRLYCRIKRLESRFPPHAPELLLFYLMHDYVSPTLVIDISDCFKEKIRAIKAYRSQFGQPAEEQGVLTLGIGDYLFHIESRSRFYGSLINVKYGEAYLADLPLKLANLTPFLGQDED